MPRSLGPRSDDLSPTPSSHNAANEVWVFPVATIWPCSSSKHQTLLAEWTSIPIQGSLCWDVDDMTLEGTCTPFCVGDPSNPYCEDRNRYCPISADGVLLLCLPICNPLQQDCPEGRVCIPVQDGWLCAPDASGDAGAYGDPCEFINVCDPGLICLDESTVPPGEACEGAAGCCTEVCNLDDPAGDLQCGGAAGGQICQAWYADGMHPPGFDNVGACALPP